MKKINGIVIAFCVGLLVSSCGSGKTKSGDAESEEASGKMKSRMSL